MERLNTKGFKISLQAAVYPGALATGILLLLLLPVLRVDQMIKSLFKLFNVCSFFQSFPFETDELPTFSNNVIKMELITGLKLHKRINVN